MIPSQDHPQQLLWYVMGDLPADQRRATRAHLLRCAACREEAEALVSMLQALRRERDPTAGERPHQASSSAQSASIPEERPPLRLVPPPASSGRRRQGMRRLALLALGAVAALALHAAWLLLRPEPYVRPLERVNRVTLLPPVRGGVPGASLEGTGPWLVQVVLPFDAPEGPYSLRLGTGKGTAGELGETVAQSDRGALELILQPLEPGHFQLTVESDSLPRRDSAVYPFEVRSSSAWPHNPGATRIGS